MKKNIFYLSILAIIPLFWAGQQNASKSVNVPLIDTNLIKDTNFVSDLVVGTSTVVIPNDTGWNFSYPINNPMFINDSVPGGKAGWSLGLATVYLPKFK